MYENHTSEVLRKIHRYNATNADQYIYPIFSFLLIEKVCAVDFLSLTRMSTSLARDKRIRFIRYLLYCWSIWFHELTQATVLEELASLQARKRWDIR